MGFTNPKIAMNRANHESGEQILGESRITKACQGWLEGLPWCLLVAMKGSLLLMLKYHYLGLVGKSICQANPPNSLN